MQLAEKARDKYVAVVDQAQKDVCKLQEYVASDVSALQRQMKDHWVRMCSNLGRAMAERVIEVRENQAQDARVVVGTYEESWNSRSNRLRQLVRDPAGTIRILVRVRVIWEMVLMVVLLILSD